MTDKGDVSPVLATGGTRNHENGTVTSMQEKYSVSLLEHSVCHGNMQYTVFAWCGKSCPAWTNRRRGYHEWRTESVSRTSQAA